MRRAAEALLWAAVASVLMCAAQPSAETTIRLKVPKQVAAQQAARAAGDAAAPSPVLMLEGLELGSGEGLTIQVLGPAEPGASRPRPVLGVAATVGPPQKALRAPLRHMTLAVPLNEKASRLLAGKSEVTLLLQVEDSPGRPPLKFKRAYFDTGEEPAQR
jgi:hypothetical protein